MTRADEELEKTRSEMIRCGIKYGLENEKTILLSKKLDILLNQYARTTTPLNKAINSNEQVFFKN